MALINKVPFVSGSVYTPEIATEMTGITFDDQPQYYGHFAKVADADLSDAPGAVKSRLANNDLNLKVTAGAGLNANYAAGRALYANTVFDITASSVALVVSAANYVYVGIDGVIRSTSALPPIVRALLAIVNTNTTGVVSVLDTREGYKLEVIKPIAFTVKNFGGRGDSGAYVATNGETLSDGEYYFTSFTVPSGVTITVDRLAKVFVTGNATIAGGIQVTQGASGGSRFIVGAQNMAAQGLAGQGFGSAGGENPSSPYSYGVSPVGSGGCGGGYYIVGGAATVTTRAGGNGGGCFWLEAAGNVNIAGSINAIGTDGEPSSVSGTSTSGWVIGAGSGGSGGLILIKALGSINVSGLLNAYGGVGGLGAINFSGLGAESGCGGGGGRIYLAAPSINTTGSTLNVGGGVAGLNNASGASIVAVNTNGGSFGGAGGSAASTSGQPGGVGVITTRLVAPLG